MEALTHAEALTLGSLLGAHGTESDRARRARTGLPKSTYQEAKRRLYEERWVEDRFFPDPSILGRSRLEFHLSSPAADKREASIREGEADPSTVVLWAGIHALFSIRFLRPTAASGAPPTAEVGTGAVVNASPSQVKVYFDFEGGWSSLPDMLSSASYPRGLPAVGPPRAGQLGSPAHQISARELVSRPFRNGHGEGPPVRLGAFFLPRSQRHLLENGSVAWRVLPKFGQPITVGDSTIRQLVLLTGSVRAEADVERLLPSLAEECRAHPFLFACDGKAGVLGLLGIGLSHLPASTARPSRPSVQGVVERFLRDVRIVREDLETLNVVVDHRYDRLLAI